jgi:hypothetical protein
VQPSGPSRFAGSYRITDGAVVGLRDCRLPVPVFPAPFRCDGLPLGASASAVTAMRHGVFIAGLPASRPDLCIRFHPSLKTCGF